MAFFSQFAGTLLSGGLSALGSAGQQKSSARMAQKQINFQREMSNTQYQRAAKDLEAAGLNRILALGNPASSPVGAMGRAENITGDAVSSAMQERRMREELRLIKAQREQTEWLTTKTAAEASEVSNRNRIVNSTMDDVIEGNRATARQPVLQNERLEAEAWLYNSGLGLILDQVSKFMPGLASAANAFKRGRLRQPVRARRMPRRERR